MITFIAALAPLLPLSSLAFPPDDPRALTPPSPASSPRRRSGGISAVSAISQSSYVANRDILNSLTHQETFLISVSCFNTEVLEAIMPDRFFGYAGVHRLCRTRDLGSSDMEIITTAVFDRSEALGEKQFLFFRSSVGT
jgi:hypothetical protein